LAKCVPVLKKNKNKMESVSKYLERVQNFMDKSKEDEFILIISISSDPKRFIEAIRFCIDHCNKPYEFSNDYTKVRRISQ